MQISIFRFLLCTVAMALAVGCGGSDSPTRDASVAALERPAAATEKGDNKSVPPGLAELDEADRQAALKQKTCPVSDEPLGSMGKPYKITIKGRTLFLCCQGCESELKADPDKYLKKLKQ